MSNNDSGLVRNDVDDAATGEFPAMGNLPDESPTAEVFLDDATLEAGDTEEPSAPVDERAPVSGWLAHLEGEIARLHSRWHRVEEELNRKDSLAAELREELHSREEAAAELSASLASSQQARHELEEALALRSAEVAELAAELDLRGVTLRESEQTLATAAKERETLVGELAAAKNEMTRLAAIIDREHAAVGEAASRNEELAAAHAAINQRVQELEAYIDGRAGRWSALRGEIADQKATIIGLEKSVRSHEHAIEEASREKRALDAAVSDLERRNAELESRLQEKESALQALEAELAAQRAASVQLDADLAERTVERDALRARALEDRARIDSLEGRVAEREASLTTLAAELAAVRSLSVDLKETRDSITERAADLEGALDEQGKRADRLRAELTANEDRLRALQQQLSERERELDESRDVAAKQTELVADLSAQLERKQQGLDVLERSVKRISDLGASVAELERRFESSTSAKAASAVPVQAAEGNKTELEELLPIESFMTVDADEGSELDDVGAVLTTCKLVGVVAGERVAFPLAKHEVTIGRSRGCDIRIQSHFISRSHARIYTRGIATTIEDIGSKNGIFVNDERVTRRVLHDGDIVTLAKELELRFIDARH